MGYSGGSDVEEEWDTGSGVVEVVMRMGGNLPNVLPLWLLSKGGWT